MGLNRGRRERMGIRYSGIVVKVKYCCENNSLLVPCIIEGGHNNFFFLSRGSKRWHDPGFWSSKGYKSIYAYL